MNKKQNKKQTNKKQQQKQQKTKKQKTTTKTTTKKKTKTNKHTKNTPHTCIMLCNFPLRIIEKSKEKLSHFSSPGPKYTSDSIVRPSSVRQHFQTSSPQKPQGH